jgi:hypothetical protein
MAHVKWQEHAAAGNKNLPMTFIRNTIAPCNAPAETGGTVHYDMHTSSDTYKAGLQETDLSPKRNQQMNLHQNATSAPS